ncbi:HipA family kinase [Tumebacillus lipolyticus]|uniref:HipA family kinase n=1 Tax=Tumebacillus lipolyticus TaxID=1280370 RepID=A0ABW4ZSE4_9BACL
MFTERWFLEQVWKEKRQGHVWRVRSAGNKRGYFKFATKDQWYFSGPMIANELIAASLAKRLGFPVSELELATVRGPNGIPQEGLISREIDAAEVITWRDADETVKSAPEQHVDRHELLAQMVVFDAWITNIDRAKGRNLILYRNSSDERYGWYLIDHGHTLYGSPRKWKRGAWNTPIWDQLWRFYNVPQGLLACQSNSDTLEPMIRKIEEMRLADIDAAIRCVPRGYMQSRERQFIKRLLLFRQQRLRMVIDRWLQYAGEKECNT